MRLLDTATGQFVDKPEDSTAALEYAVLSHTWADPEAKYEDILEMQHSSGVFYSHVSVRWFTYTVLFLLRILAFPFDHTPMTSVFLLGHWVDRFENWTRKLWRLSILGNPTLPSKTSRACAIAREGKIPLIWIDSSCVDHGNKAELRQTVSSVYTWFRNATMCYVYLADVWHTDNPWAQGSSFRSSRWFTRCWTLQELVAPPKVTFLSKEWVVIGTKVELADVIEEIIGIDRNVLNGSKSIDDVGVVHWISWAVRQEARNPEDAAYCLLGLLKITMTPRYGEGKWAFRRLREKILQRNPTESLEEVQWYTDDVPELSHTLMLITAILSPPHDKLIKTTPHHSLLAPSSRAFLFSGNIRPLADSADFYNRLSTPDHVVQPLPHRAFHPSPFGIRTPFYLIPFPPATVAAGTEAIVPPQWYLVILSCEDSSFPLTPHLLGRLCYTIPGSNSTRITLNIGEFSRGDISPSTILRRIDTRQGQTSLIHLPNFRRDFTSNLLHPPVKEDIYIPRHKYPSHFGHRVDWFGTKPPEGTKITVQSWTRKVLSSKGYCIQPTTTPGAPLTHAPIFLSYSSTPLIVRLKKEEHEAAIFLPIREHPYDGYQFGWIVDDNDGADKILPCGVVPSSDPDFKALMEHGRARTIPPSLLKNLKERCDSRKEWNVGREIARPKVERTAAGHYELLIEIDQL